MRRIALSGLILGLLAQVGWSLCDPVTPATPTTRAGMQKPVINACGWGTTLNGDMDIIDTSAAFQGLPNTFTSQQTFGQPIIMQNQQSIKFFDATTHSINLQAPPVASQTTFVLPVADGTSGQALTTDGSGNLQFLTITGGGSGGGSLAITQSGVSVSSPTPAIDFLGPPFTATLLGGVTTQITIPVQQSGIVFGGATNTIATDTNTFTWNNTSKSLGVVGNAFFGSTTTVPMAWDNGNNVLRLGGGTSDSSSMQTLNGGNSISGLSIRMGSMAYGVLATTNTAIQVTPLSVNNSADQMSLALQANRNGTILKTNPFVGPDPNFIPLTLQAGDAASITHSVTMVLNSSGMVVSSAAAIGGPLTLSGPGIGIAISTSVTINGTLSLSGAGNASIIENGTTGQIVLSTNVPVAGNGVIWLSSYTLGVGVAGNNPGGNIYDVQVASPGLTSFAGYDNFTNNGTTVTYVAVATMTIPNVTTQTATGVLFNYQSSSMTISSETITNLTVTTCVGCGTGGGGGGGSSTLAVTTGAVSGFTGPPISSPTAVVEFDSATFQGRLTGSATAFMQLNPSSVTLQGLVTAASLGALTANQTITLSGDSSGTGTTAITVTAASTQNNIKTITSPETFTSSVTMGGGVLTTTETISGEDIILGSATFNTNIGVSSNVLLSGASFYNNAPSQINSLLANTVTVSSNTLLSGASFYNNAPGVIGGVGSNTIFLSSVTITTGTITPFTSSAITGLLKIGEGGSGTPVAMSIHNAATGAVLGYIGDTVAGNMNIDQEQNQPLAFRTNGSNRITIAGNGVTTFANGIIASAFDTVNSTLQVVAPITGAYSATFSTTNANYQVAITTLQVISVNGSSLTATSCGTSPSVVGTNAAFTITPGATATGCTITFNPPLKNTPTCLVTPQTLSLVNALSYTESNTALTISQTALTEKLDVHCWGQSE